MELYRGLFDINTEDIGKILSEGMESSIRVNFDDKWKEKYKKEVGVDVEEADKEELLEKHWDATPKIEGKGGAYLMSFTSNPKVAKNFGDYLVKMNVPDERIASSSDEIKEDTLFVECPHDYEKEITSLEPKIPSEYIHSIEGEDGSWYLNSDHKNPRSLN